LGDRTVGSGTVSMHPAPGLRNGEGAQRCCYLEVVVCGSVALPGPRTCWTCSAVKRRVNVHLGTNSPGDKTAQQSRWRRPGRRTGWPDAWCRAMVTFGWGVGRFTARSQNSVFRGRDAKLHDIDLGVKKPGGGLWSGLWVGPRLVPVLLEPNRPHSKTRWVATRR